MQVMEPLTQGKVRRELGKPKFTYDRNDDGQLIDADGRVVREPERARKIWQNTTLPDPQEGEEYSVYIATLKPGSHNEIERTMILGVDFHRHGLTPVGGGAPRHKKVKLTPSQVEAIKERAANEHVNTGPNRETVVCLGDLIVLQQVGDMPQAENPLDAELAYAQSSLEQAKPIPMSLRDAIYAVQAEGGDGMSDDDLIEALRDRLVKDYPAGGAGGGGNNRNGRRSKSAGANASDKE